MDVHYRKELHEFHNDIPFLWERMKDGNVGKLLANMYGKKEQFIGMIKNKNFCTYKILKNIKSWVSIKKKSA